MKNKFLAAVIIPSLFLGTINIAHAGPNLIKNGSFEVGNKTSLKWDSLSSGDTALTDWTIGKGGIDWHDGVEFGNAYDGNLMIDLDSNGPGSISQTFSTITGASYKLSFALTSPYTAFSPADLHVSVGDADIDISMDRSHLFHLNWNVETLNFMATSNLTTLTFSENASTGFWGPVIDNVSVTAPESNTCAMMLVGLGMLGSIRLRRKTAAVGYSR